MIKEAYMLKTTIYSGLTLILCLAISACGTQNSSQNINSAAAKPVTISNEISAIYQRSCKNCHEVQATGAPLTGDKKHWAEILEKGMNTVLDRAMNGYQGMPPFGQCFECSPEQIETLITYMSNPAK